MTILVTPGMIGDRRRVATGGLSALAASLAADLERAMASPLEVPEQKALLSREGGRCPVDETMLAFDPYSPRAHYCPRCDRTYTGELHDRFWIYWYQLWLAERAVHASLLGALGVVPDATRFATRILEQYCDRYPAYPNADNALGPTRPFFSTYLESIWLLQLCVALELLESTPGGRATGNRFRDVVIEPSRALIASYDESASNRQVWNNAALMAASLALGRPDEAESILWARSGVVSHLGTALLPDGSWYEGENYHLFAHRGLWYAMRMADANDFEIPADLVARYEKGFVTPLLTSLPDLTFPSRRDSQYAISLRQWRFAELCELGLARGRNQVLAGMLGRLYAPDIPRSDTGRWKSSAEAERNLPPSALSRADLGWKSLLFASEHGQSAAPSSLGSVLLESQGIGVLRRDNDRVYVGLDYGVSGGGHGHPDRLNLLLMKGDQRILDDQGSGSYVDPMLHWYRSSLAHNAPMCDGRSQPRVDGGLIAYEDRGAAGWIAGVVAIASEAVARRAVVVMPDYVVDQVEWTSQTERRFDLPLHVDAMPRNAGGESPAFDNLEGSQQLEDGFRFLRDVSLLATIPAGETVALTGPMADLWIGADAPLQLWRAIAPGAPGHADEPMLLARISGMSGMIRSVWSWKSGVRSASLFPGVVVDTAEGRHEHSRVDHGWNIVIQVGAAKSSIDLEGLVPAEHVQSVLAFNRAALGFNQVLQGAPPAALVTALAPGAALRSVLGEQAYRRSEQTWKEAGSPTAEIVGLNENGKLRVAATVHADRSFVPPGTVNRLDNEQADINGAGLQLYLRSHERTAAYVIVPIEGSTALAIRPIDGWGGAIPVTGSWWPIADGYQVELLVDPPSPELGLELIVNEKPFGRERRRGQLVLTSQGGGYVYLRGDRHDARSLVTLRLDRDG